MCTLEELRRELEAQLGLLKLGLKDIMREELLRMGAVSPQRVPVHAAAAAPFLSGGSSVSHKMMPSSSLDTPQTQTFSRQHSGAGPSAEDRLRNFGNFRESKSSLETILATLSPQAQLAVQQGAVQVWPASPPSDASMAVAREQLVRLMEDEPTHFFSRHRRGYMAGKELYESPPVLECGEDEMSEDQDFGEECMPMKRRAMTLDSHALDAAMDLGNPGILGSSYKSATSSLASTPLGVATTDCFGCLASCLRGFVLSSYFELGSAILIVLNAALLGVETNAMAQDLLESAPSEFQLAERMFCGVFVVEIMMRFLVYGSGFWRTEGWQWNLLDLCAVLLLVVDVLSKDLLDAVSSHPHEDMDQVLLNLNIVRILRVVKLARVVIILRPLRNLEDLRTIIVSLVGTARTLLWTAIFSFIVIYVFAILLTQIVTFHLAHASDEEERQQLQHHFGSVGRAILVLFQSISNGVDWGSVLDPLVLYISPWLAVPVCAYILFGIFALMNIVTGVFVESALDSARKEKERFLLHTVRRLFAATDDDGSGDISWKEFARTLNHPEMQEYFKIIDVDIDEAEDLFKLIDIDDSGSIDPEEFVNGCMRLQGPAKAIDLATLMHEHKRAWRREVIWRRSLAEAFAAVLAASERAAARNGQQLAPQSPHQGAPGVTSSAVPHASSLGSLPEEEMAQQSLKVNYDGEPGHQQGSSCESAPQWAAGAFQAPAEEPF